MVSAGMPFVLIALLMGAMVYLAGTSDTRDKITKMFVGVFCCVVIAPLALFAVWFLILMIGLGFGLGGM